MKSSEVKIKQKRKDFQTQKLLGKGVTGGNKWVNGS